NKHQNIESQIYNVVVNVLNQVTYNKFENDQDKIYQAAEKLLMGYKNTRGDSIEAVRSGLQILGESISNDGYMDFKTLLYQELCKSDYEELYREIRLLQQDEESDKTSRIEHSVNEVKQEVREIKKIVLYEKNANKENSSTIQNYKFHNNKKQDYVKTWNSRLFLHVDNDEDPITLADAFIMPDYEMYKSIKRIGFSDDDTFDQIIDKFMRYDRTSTMLITGVPGIGKSSVTSWIANEYKDNENVVILRFRDWKRQELENGLLYAIFDRLNGEYEELEEKILILDGFDELKILDTRDTLLNNFVENIKDFENFKCIITSRPAYINSTYFNNVFGLREFDISKIDIFYKIITGNTLNNKKKIETNLEVLGIPVILYMAVMSNIDISENPTKPELYNRIFAEKGGIFDRFSCDGVEYDKGAQVLRNGENIKTYLSFLQKVSFVMFENNTLNLKMEDCNVPELEFQGNKVSVLEFPIKHLFENAEINVEFIHKSIYEYFVSEHIFSSLLTTIDSSTDELAKTLGCLFKYNSITNEILEFLGFKIINSKLNKEFKALDKAFRLMLQDGMIYYTKEIYKNAFKREMDVFSNMLEILHLWKDDYLEFDNLIVGYLRYNRNSHLNLKGIILSPKKEDNDKQLDFAHV
ncbi:NACHT domain-containing NTPase, partial [uncultured Clostridium sp.]|uniref:NACHT domain-containing protein n=2 Tax=uncultured Clostridium sp. TaxID=59620 RepID=UPI00272E80B0